MRFLLRFSACFLAVFIFLVSNEAQTTPITQVDNWAALKALPLTVAGAKQSVLMKGRLTANDGGGGIFFPVVGSAVAEDGGTVAAPNLGGGRWFRQYSGALNALWFGCVGDGATDNTAIIQSIPSAYGVTTNGCEIYFPRGNYLITKLAFIDQRVDLTMEGGGGEWYPGTTSGLNAVTMFTSHVNNTNIISYTVADHGNGATAGRWSVLRNVAIVGDITKTNQTGLYVGNRGIRVENGIVVNCGLDGVYLGDSVGTVFEKSVISHNGRDGIRVKGDYIPNNITVNYFNNGLIYNNGITFTGNGITVVNGIGSMGGLNVVVQSNTGYGIDLQGNGGVNPAFGCRFYAVHDELNVLGSVNFEAGSRYNFVDFTRYSSGAPVDNGIANGWRGVNANSPSAGLVDVEPTVRTTQFEVNTSSTSHEANIRANTITAALTPYFPVSIFQQNSDTDDLLLGNNGNGDAVIAVNGAKFLRFGTYTSGLNDYVDISTNAMNPNVDNKVVLGTGALRYADVETVLLNGAAIPTGTANTLIGPITVPFIPVATSTTNLGNSYLEQGSGSVVTATNRAIQFGSTTNKLGGIFLGPLNASSNALSVYDSSDVIQGGFGPAGGLFVGGQTPPGAKKVSVYTSDDGAGNYLRLSLTGGTLFYESLGTGGSGSFDFGTGANNSSGIGFNVQNSRKWLMGATSMNPVNDATSQLGDATHRVKYGFFGGSTETTSNPIASFDQTWNSAGVSFTGLKINITDNAAANLSPIVDFQMSGTSAAKFVRFASGYVGLVLGSSSQKRAALLPGSGGAGFEYDSAGTFSILSAANANVGLGSGTVQFNIAGGAPASSIDIDSSGNVRQVSKTTKYNNIATVSGGIPAEYATIDSTGLTANVGATTLYAVPASGVGMYRVSAYLVTTTAASVSSTMPNAQVVYTDNDSNTSVTLDVTPILGAAGLGQSGTLAANTIGTVFSGTVVIYVKASTTVQYQTVNYSSTAAGLAYALRMKLEAL